MTRVYVPATLERLRDWHSSGRLDLTGAVVAPGSGEDEEQEALDEAAQLAADLLPGAGRRVVVVLEPTEAPPGPGDGVVEVPRVWVRAVHADTDEVDPSTDPDDLPWLGWFATQEVPALVADERNELPGPPV